MKRLLLAGAALLFAAVELTHAEYVIIIANVGQGKNAGGIIDNNPGPMNPGGGPMEPGGGLGPPGGMGPGGGLGPPGGPMGPGGSGPGGGPMGPGGGYRPPGGPMGPGGGVGPPGGPMGPGGIVGPGGMGPGGIGGEFLDEDPDPTALHVVTVVEVTSVLRPEHAALIGKAPVYIGHRWGGTVLAPSERILISAMPKSQTSLRPSVSRSWDDAYRKVMKDVKRDEKPPLDEMLRLAGRALEWGLLSEYGKAMDHAADVDPKHASTAAYLKIKEELAKPTPASKQAGVWRERLNRGFKIREGAHYTLLHQAPKDDSPDVVSRVNRLEDSFRGFYYWFALKGVALSVPKERFVAVLVPQENEFNRIHQTFDGQPLVTDGFHARRDNLTVFSAVRRDEAYLALRKYMNPHLADRDPQDLLKGKGKTIQDFQLGTAVLMLKSLEKDSELSSVSHEVPRQLLAGAGLLPRNVNAPEWVQFGLGSFFETPSGAAWASYGAAGSTLLDQHNYLLNYKLWAKNKKLDKPEVQLEKCITDVYFRASSEKDPAASLKARTHAWGLTYFLAQTRLPQLMNYYKELGKLPRDLDFDSEVLMTTFGRAFGMLDRDGKVNGTQFKRLAAEWHQYMTNTPLELEEVINMVRKGQAMLKEGKHPGANQGGNQGGNPGGTPPGYPGGPGGAPGGGFPGGPGGAPGGPGGYPPGRN